MIGTRHEQAVLVVLAYVVGFVTAYIAYGISNYESAKIVYIESGVIQTERAIADERVNAAVASAMSNQAAAVYESGMLMATIGQEQFVLSVDVEEVDDSMIDFSSFAAQGLHEVMPKYEVSPDGQFIFFCESYVSEDTCRAFIFSVAENVIRPISRDGVNGEIDIPLVMSATWTDSGFRLGQYGAVAADTPWLLTAQ